MKRTRRSYRQVCGLARALDIVGERWTLLIVRNLLLGPLRYSDLLRGLPGITTNLLAKRLREMEESGIVERLHGAGADGAQSYRLTPLGSALEPAVHALGAWGWHRMSAPPKKDFRSMDFLFVALRRRYRGGGPLRAELVVDGTPYRVVTGGKAAEIARGELPNPEIRVRGDRAAFMKLFLEPYPRTGVPAGLEVEGNASQLRALASAFEKGDA